MEENFPEEVLELFIQDGVMITAGPAAYMHYINTVGTLAIVEYPNSNLTRCIEWKPIDVTIDSDMQDQEWQVVNTIAKRHRTFSGNLPTDTNPRTKYLKINMNEVKSFRVAAKNQKLAFRDGKGDCLCSFVFQHGNCDALVAVLKGLLTTVVSKRDKYIFCIVDDINNSERRQLDRSFAELNLFSEQSTDYVWKFVKNFHNRPYETTMEAFSKITDIVYRSPDHRLLDNEVNDILNRSLEAIENSTTTHSHDEYEVVPHVPKLPTRKDYPRGRPLSFEQWKALQDNEGQVEDVEAVKLVIFRGGISRSVRKEVWKYLLDYHAWDNTTNEQQNLVKQRNEEYYVMKLQWRSMTKMQEDNFTDYRERKSIIEKDVNRTDRTMDYFAGENNPNLQVLFDILMTYAMYNFDLGYVQGMSDLLSPILYLMNNEVDAFWCFVGFMNKVIPNFDIDQAGMKEQLQHLQTLTAFVDPEFANYLYKHDSANMFFCFRWLLVWFKRELSQEDVMRLWEVLWTGLPCQNFHLLICVAILDTEKTILIDNNYGFTEILKHINDLSGNIDIATMISKAEGMYNQIVAAEHLTDSIRLIIGLPILGTIIADSKEASPDISDLGPGSVNSEIDECNYESAISNSFL
ncbi:hypothetical protein FQA39_LY08486 [Lamprigera yunnana]|nr:hypothetical protein FQA39_LY08486 [Lamprigera yunnana]